MNPNYICIQQTLDFIEQHLDESSLNLEQLSIHSGYSKYHFHRMFSAITGYPVHLYIKRRRLDEAASHLVSSDESIMEIALESGYETQRSFAREFRKQFGCSPSLYRRRNHYTPLQPSILLAEDAVPLPVNWTIEIMDRGPLHLVGFETDTKYGFSGIGRSWKRLHKHKLEISQRTDVNALIGLNDYSAFAKSAQPAFTYLAAAEVSAYGAIPKGMSTKDLPASRYAVFHFKGRNEDSMEDAADYIYGTWFLHSSCEFREDVLYDFITYGEETDTKGCSQISYWIPIK